MLEEKGFTYELITEFTYKIIMSKDSPLAKLDTISFDDLVDYIEIAHADPYVPSVPVSKVVKEELSDDTTSSVTKAVAQLHLTSMLTTATLWVTQLLC